jgi:hypothetical protein
VARIGQGVHNLTCAGVRVLQYENKNMSSPDIVDGFEIENETRRGQAVKIAINGPGGPTIEAAPGVPSGARVRGSLVINTTTGELYICTVAAGTYVKVGSQS